MDYFAAVGSGTLIAAVELSYSLRYLLIVSRWFITRKVSILGGGDDAVDARARWDGYVM